MKTIVILLSSLIISQPANAARTCEDYITDEWPDSRYTVDDILGDNVVTDNKTGLMWKQCSEGLSGADCLTGTASVYRWQQALAVPEALNATGFASFTDWRLPNVEELRSITTMNCFEPAVNETAFPNTPFIWFWSSSPAAGAAGAAWSVRFSHGAVSFRDRRHDDVSVRLVRSKE